ncbi:MAG: DedA family protein [Spirochaetales bacterium]|nr:DedA family protein [Spirochaetales bacterium]
MEDNPKLSLKSLISSSGMVREDGSVRWGRLILSMVVILCLFLLVFGGIALILRENMDSVAAFITEKLGLPGVFGFTLIIDTIIVPLSVDLFFPFASQWDPVLFLGVVSVASILGGIGGYWIGRLLGHTPFVRKVTGSFSEDGQRMIRRYGAWAVVIGALTPIPYSVTCWLAGMMKVPFGRVSAACLFRSVRMVVYYLIVTGALSALV